MMHWAHPQGEYDSIALLREASRRLGNSLPRWEVTKASGTTGSGATGSATLPSPLGASRFDSTGASVPYESLGILQGPDTLGNFGANDNVVVMGGRRPFAIGLSPWAWS